MSEKTIVLASTSPFRRELLFEKGVHHQHSRAGRLALRLLGLLLGGLVKFRRNRLPGFVQLLAGRRSSALLCYRCLGTF